MVKRVKIIKTLKGTKVLKSLRYLFNYLPNKQNNFKYLFYNILRAYP
jgi:hypothetical protein